MAESPSLIEDFLDQGPEHFKPGRYYFTEDEIEFISDIPSEIFNFRVLRKPNAGVPGIVDISPLYVQLGEVFSTTHATTPTHVERMFQSNLTYEATLELFVRDSGGIIVIFGPSKLGKTVLWKSVIESADCVIVSCSSGLSVEDLYQTIAHRVEQPLKVESIEKESGVTTSAKSAEIKAGKGVEAALSKGSSKSLESSRQDRFLYSDRAYNIDFLVNALKKTKRIIVFENYHRLSETTFRQLSIDLRTLSDNLINTLFVGIPEDPYEIIKFNSELESRISFLPFSAWNQTELRQIAVGGEQTLRIRIIDSSLDFLAKEAAGSPLLMQLYCYIACLSAGIIETQDMEKEISINEKDFSSIMKKWGIQKLEHCKTLWEKVVRFSTSSEGLPPTFIQSIIKKIKEPDPKLCIQLSKLKLWPKYRGGIKDLISKLNSDESTVDIFSLDEVLDVSKIRTGVDFP